MPQITALPDRGFIAVSGEDTDTFLQGLISADVTKITADKAGYGAFLSPQGKFLFDFFLYRVGEALIVECEGDRVADLKKRLSMYKLRSKVTIEDASDAWAVFVAWGDNAAQTFDLTFETGTAKAHLGGVVCVDPRLAQAGVRLLLPHGTDLDGAGDAADAAAYDSHRIALGLADGSRDMVVDKALLLENGFEELNGVDWQKGCFMGQELTARTRYRGLVKRRLLPVTVVGPTPAPGTPVMLDDREVGEMRSGTDGLGLALMRLDALEKAESFTCGDAALSPQKPDWVVFQADAS